MSKKAIRICIALIVVLVLAAVAMLCTAFMLEKPEYHASPDANRVTAADPTELATLRPTAEPTAEIAPGISMDGYIVDFDDDIAIRSLPDGSIEATVAEYDQAEWDTFKAEGHTWATQYTDDEYRAEIDGYASMDSFRRMQGKGKYISVSANCYGTLAGVTEDGKAVFNSRAVRRYDVDEADSKWTGLQQISLGSYGVIALKQDGTIAWQEGNGSFAKGTHPSEWTDVVQIASDMISVGLRSDGTVYYSCHNSIPFYPDEYLPLIRINDWTDIVQVDTSWEKVVGLKADGTVVAAGDNHLGQLEVSHWTDIKKISVGMNHVVGLKTDGTIVSTDDARIISSDGSVDGRTLTNVVDVFANRNYTLVVLSDGSTVLLGERDEYAGGNDGAWAAEQWSF